VSGAGAPEAFALDALPARPWKNGAGLTREIAVHPPGAGLEHFDWRISVAEVARDGPFSAFPGIDRCIVLLHGAGMRLRLAGAAEHLLDAPGVPFTFPGEVAVEAELLGGATSDLNVMTRRGGWRAEVVSLQAAAALAPGDAALVLCCAGAWRVGPSQDIALSTGQGLLWRAAAPSLHLQPDASQGEHRLLVVRLCHDDAP
jgi:environmental stress-induced protein Ves